MKVLIMTLSLLMLLMFSGASADAKMSGGLFGHFKIAKTRHNDWGKGWSKNWEKKWNKGWDKGWGRKGHH